MDEKIHTLKSCNNLIDLTLQRISQHKGKTELILNLAIFEEKVDDGCDRLWRGTDVKADTISHRWSAYNQSNTHKHHLQL